MNVERVHAILKVIQNEMASSKSVAALGELVNSLQNQVNQPQEASHQQQVADHLKTLRKRLLNVPSNDFSPGWRLILKEIGGAELLGETLIQRLDAIFQRNQITPSVALEEIRAIHEGHQQFADAVEKMLASLAHFKVGCETLEAGEAEVGVLIPRAAVGNSLAKFGKELEELEDIFNVFSEIVTGTRSPIEIRTISSSEFQVFLESFTATAACTAFAIERIVSLYEKLLNIRRLRQELQAEEVPEDGLEGVNKYAESLIAKGVDELTEEVLAKYHSKADLGRTNEISIELKYSLKKIAYRIDRGYNIEVRAEALPEATAEEGEEIDPSNEVKRQQIETILNASKTLRYRKLEGAPILSLPESESANGENKD